jgi:bla regulator protein BlaR1
MIILEDVLSQEIVQKLGWTLLHFVWQAAVVALLLATLLKLLRKSTANLRYIIACMALGLIVLLPVITIQLVPVSAPHMAAHIEPVPAGWL